MKVKNFAALILLTALNVKADLTQSEKNTLLNLHRNARAEVNSSNMKELFWDDELANIAQTYANSCPGIVHSGTGPENIATRASGTVTDLFNQFMEDKDAFDKSNYRKKFVCPTYEGEIIGHYSQIVWADNTKLGCGLANSSYKGSVYGLFLVCRYQTGNIIGREVYAVSNSTNTKATTTRKPGSIATDYIDDTDVYSEPSSSGKRISDISKYSVWFLSCLLSYGLLNNILSL